MKKSFILTLRLFKRHLARFLTIIAIVFVSIGFMSGVGEAEKLLHKKSNDVYFSQNLSDLYLKSKKKTGFELEEIKKIEEIYGAENIMKTYCFEFVQNSKVTRVYSFDLNNINVNKLEIVEGRLPENELEVLVERKTKLYEGASIGDTVNINGTTYTVSGIANNPFLMHRVQESSYSKARTYVSQVFYINSNSLTTINDIYVTFENRELFDFFNDEYEQKVAQEKENVLLELEAKNVRVISLYENLGLYSVKKYARTIESLGEIFVVFFLLITMLIVYSTMVRLLDEERHQIACQKTLGYSNFSIAKRYMFFAFIATIIGGLLSFGIGLLLTRMIYVGMCAHYELPAIGGTIGVSYYFATFAMILIATCLLTLLTGLTVAAKRVSELMRPKMIQTKKKLLIERVPFIWNHLKLKYRSTIRNTFLFKSRFLMTFISIIGSSVLVTGGLGLYDSVNHYEGMSVIIAVAVFVILFSAALSMLVIYNITNINVSERQREIATLMVVGYRQKEITGYIFREIYVMCFMGAICGIPFGYWFLKYMFSVLGFGSVSQISTWVWILSPILTMLFSILATLVLKPKILKVDMNGSLKITE